MAPSFRWASFSQSRLAAFGGAYAVLPYVYQGAVEHYLWLTPQQMIDGLAVGETTLGPLIMVVTFVGFVRGWVTQVLGPKAHFVSAFTGATVVTFFTFLPSFIFIFMGAPFIETKHGKLSFTARLKAITAAVVGVIFNLAVFFAGLGRRCRLALDRASHRSGSGDVSLQCRVILVLLSCGMLGMVWRLASKRKTKQIRKSFIRTGSAGRIPVLDRT
ncbi:chromate transporter [Nitrosospira sp. Is2]|uniref:chromate transporter n=1 Tax=Nitrosospira sp. Is2 TaxID=3080532 RepID=UPI002953577E|nr:chromate transporter [Nitrosospira sp. Is2]WON73445.1 chromate transporter [Nitrosospira sp. Is2]